MMWVKICGVRNMAGAESAVAAGADALGLNFVPSSPRCITESVAAQIVRALPEAIEKVGVFVNAPAGEMLRIAEACGLTCVQLHGDEPADVVAKLAPLRVIRAYRCGAAGLAPLGDSLSRCRALGAWPWACLVDAASAGAYGGTGTVAPWELIARDYNRDEWPPLILAGGLTPKNVAEAIRVVRPWGVDTASGVESAVGVKDAGLVERFVRGARG